MGCAKTWKNKEDSVWRISPTQASGQNVQWPGFRNYPDASPSLAFPDYVLFARDTSRKSPKVIVMIAPRYLVSCLDKLITEWVR
jgi:hypothetical protein